MYFFAELERILQSRKKEAPAKSYTKGLLERAPDAILKKIGEESGELIIAAKNMLSEGASAHHSLEAQACRKEFIHESADLLFHLLLLLVYEGVELQEISEELERRHKKPGA